MVRKIQLNDEQWNILGALLEANNRRRPTVLIKDSDRLKSNGLVAEDREGGKFLTDQGLNRLGQDR